MSQVCPCLGSGGRWTGKGGPEGGVLEEWAWETHAGEEKNPGPGLRGPWEALGMVASKAHRRSREGSTGNP